MAAREYAPLPAGLLALALLLAQAGSARRFVVRLSILAVRGLSPLMILFTVRNMARLVLSPGIFRPRRLLWRAVSMWSIAEAFFFAYMHACYHHLNSQTTRRWQAVTAHATEEKRKATMERYLLALKQVCQARSSHAIQGHGGPKAPAGTSAARAGSSASPGRPVKRSGSFSLPRIGSLQHVSSGSLLASREASVDNLLKLWEGEGREVITEAHQQELTRTELSTMFRGPGIGSVNDMPSWLHRGNIEDWVAHFWFRGSVPEDLSSRERLELQRMVDMLLKSAGIECPPGRNPQVTAYRIFSEPLPVIHRPLFLYLGTSLVCPVLAQQVMVMFGFQRERVGGLYYWYRPPRDGVPSRLDIAGPKRTPLVFLHGLGIGLVPYCLFIRRLSRRHSGDLYVPELRFLAMAPWENVPSAREVVAQLQDMLAANSHAAAHFMGHSFGTIVIGWLLKMSRKSVICTTFMDPPQLFLMKSDCIHNIMNWAPLSCFAMICRFMVFRELFTVNLLCRNFYWEQCSTWPEEFCVPTVIALAEEDHIVSSFFVRRLLEHECEARERNKIMQKGMLGDHIGVGAHESKLHVESQNTEPIDILWCEGFFHGEILCDRAAAEKLFAKCVRMVCDLAKS